MSINATLIVQMIVFAILVWFTMRFVWPPITAALDERAKKIADGLSAADKAKSELAAANQRVEQQLAAARDDAAKRLADAERLAQQIVEDAKTKANDEGAKIIAAAKAEAEQEAVKAREALREQVLAMAGALLLLVGRIPSTPAPQPAAALVAQAPVVTGTPATSPEPVHQHETAPEATPTEEALPGMATPVSAGDLSVTLRADTRYAAPMDLTLTVTDDAGAPVTGARITLFPEMAGMGASESLPAVEQEPGTYVAAYAPLTMPGQWEIAVRISPKGQPSSTVRFGLDVGGG